MTILIRHGRVPELLRLQPILTGRHADVVDLVLCLAEERLLDLGFVVLTEIVGIVVYSLRVLLHAQFLGSKSRLLCVHNLLPIVVHVGGRCIIMEDLVFAHGLERRVPGAWLIVAVFIELPGVVEGAAEVGALGNVLLEGLGPAHHVTGEEALELFDLGVSVLVGFC
jgi:hypothetical protein